MNFESFLLFWTMFACLWIILNAIGVILSGGFSLRLSAIMTLVSITIAMLLMKTV